MESNPSNTVYVDWTTDVNETSDLNGILLYPNPTESQINIEAEGLQHIRVFNLTGQEVVGQKAEGDHAVIDLSNEPKGCYFIEVTTDHGCSTTKIIRL